METILWTSLSNLRPTLSHLHRYCEVMFFWSRQAPVKITRLAWSPSTFPLKLTVTLATLKHLEVYINSAVMVLFSGPHCRSVCGQAVSVKKSVWAANSGGVKDGGKFTSTKEGTEVKFRAKEGIFSRVAGYEWVVFDVWWKNTREEDFDGLRQPLYVAGGRTQMLGKFTTTARSSQMTMSMWFAWRVCEQSTVSFDLT